jgi:hypothetical protein
VRQRLLATSSDARHYPFPVHLVFPELLAFLAAGQLDARGQYILNHGQYIRTA